jgi:hypothetical protein
LRLTIGAVLGAIAWLGLRQLFPHLPPVVSFIVTFLLFTAGTGRAVTARLTRDLEPWRRLVIALGAGSAITPVIIDTLGRMGAVQTYPFIASALCGAGLSMWRTGPILSPERAREAKRDAVACLALVAFTMSLGYVVFAHRFTADANGVVLYGDYDSADLGYYAAEASESTHTVPPLASYYSGHQLNAAYFPQLVLGMIHRFAGVPVLSMYYGFGWPAFLSIGALTAFALVRSLASRGASLLAVILIVVGSDFSYLAAWWLPHAAIDWDYLLWPTNFLSTTVEVQHFSTWSPSLPVFWTALVAIVESLRTRRVGWLLLSAAMIAILFQFKPFAYVVLLAGLGAAAVFLRGDWPVRLRLAGTAALGVIFTAPFLLAVSMIPKTDRRSSLLIDPFFLPRKMLDKIDLERTFSRAADHLALWPALHTPIYLLLATLVFLPVGIGIRCLGLPGVWRAVRGNAVADNAAWRVLGWTAIAGILIPFVVRTEPYVDTIQFYMTGLYILWIFTGVALAGFARRRGSLGRAAVLAVIVVSLPSTAHYLAWKWTEATRSPKASLSPGDVKIAAYLRTQDPETTVVLHDRPLSPSLMTIVSERRIVLGWDVRYSAVGGEDRLRDVQRFFSSASGNAEAATAMLAQYRVTHVIVRREDRVHPEVLSRLRLLMQFPEVALYEVSK